MGQTVPSATLQMTHNKEEWLIPQRDLNRLEKWADRIHLKINKEKCKRSTLRHQHMLAATQLERSLAKDA